MKKEMIKKVMVYDQEVGTAFAECMGKIQSVLSGGEDSSESGREVEYIRVCIPGENPMAVTNLLEAEIRKASPDMVIIPATALGEEVAPALGIRLGSGVAAHCSDILVNEEGRMAYMVPAFGGKVIGEIFIPDTSPAIVTVKPGVFTTDSPGEYGEVICDSIGSVDRSFEEGAEGADLVLVDVPEYDRQKNPIDKADLIFCGGFGIGSAENWNNLERLAEIAGGALGCTRPVVDMGWGPCEQSMIGTSGRTVRSKLYVGFGISGAAHHLCGIKDSDVIVNINNDETAESLLASDYKAVADAGAVINSLIKKLG